MRILFIAIFFFFLVIQYKGASSQQSAAKNASTMAYNPTAWREGRAVYEAHLVGLFTASSELPVFHEVVKPALDLAIDEAEKRFPMIKFKMSMRRGSNDCQRNYAGAHAAEEYYLRKVDAFIGPACSLALDAVGRMASYWNVPVFTAGGIGAEFSNKALFQTLTRLSFSLGMFVWFLLQLNLSI